MVHPALATGIWCTVLWLGYFGFLSFLSRVFFFYFLLLFPAAAVCGGLYASQLVSSIASARQTRSAAIEAAVMGLLVVVGYAAYPLFERKLSYFEEGKTKRYAFPQSGLPEAIQGPFKELFWVETRRLGNRYNTITRYLWHISRDFTTARKIAEVVKVNAREGDAIFGDASSTPLVALLAGRPIVDHFVDTNGMRFQCNMPSLEELRAQLDAALHRKRHRFTFLLLRMKRGFARRTDPTLKPLQRFFACTNRNQ